MHAPLTLSLCFTVSYEKAGELIEYFGRLEVFNSVVTDMYNDDVRRARSKGNPAAVEAERKYRRVLRTKKDLKIVLDSVLERPRKNGQVSENMDRLRDTVSGNAGEPSQSVAETDGDIAASNGKEEILGEDEDEDDGSDRENSLKKASVEFHTLESLKVGGERDLDTFSVASSVWSTQTRISCPILGARWAGNFVR